MTTILCVRKNDEVVMAGDGQATLGEAIVFKSKSIKVRRIGNGKIIAGFAGAALLGYIWGKHDILEKTDFPGLMDETVGKFLRIRGKLSYFYENFHL